MAGRGESRSLLIVRPFGRPEYHHLADAGIQSAGWRSAPVRRVFADTRNELVQYYAGQPPQANGDCSREWRNVAKQAGFQFDLESSMKYIGRAGRQYIQPNIRNQNCREALESILKPVGLTYRTEQGVMVLEKK